MWTNGYVRAEATREAEREWTEHVTQMYASMLLRKAQSWFTGYNSNVDGHEAGNVRYLVYTGGTPKFVKKISEMTRNGYTGITFESGFSAAAGARRAG